MFFSVFNFLSSYLNNVLRQKYCFIVSFDGTFFFSLLGEFGVLYSQSTTMTSTFIYQFEWNLYVDSLLRQQYFVIFLGLLWLSVLSLHPDNDSTEKVLLANIIENFAAFSSFPSNFYLQLLYLSCSNVWNYCFIPLTIDFDMTIAFDTPKFLFLFFNFYHCILIILIIIGTFG